MKKLIEIESITHARKNILLLSTFARIETKGKRMRVALAPRSSIEVVNNFNYTDITITELERFAGALRYLVFNDPQREEIPSREQIIFNSLSLKLAFECTVGETVFFCSSRSPRRRPFSTYRMDKVIDMTGLLLGREVSTTLAPERVHEIVKQIYGLAVALRKEAENKNGNHYNMSIK